MNKEQTWFVLEGNGVGLTVAKFTVRHHGRQEAEAREEAKRLSKDKHDVVFYVVQAVCSAFTRIEEVTKETEL